MDKAEILVRWSRHNHMICNLSHVNGDLFIEGNGAKHERFTICWMHIQYVMSDDV